MPEQLVLVGMMGAGKTVVGAALAHRLDRRFVDLDGAVEARLGRPVAELFATEGEAAFRAAETAALEEALKLVDGAVVAAGGGVVLSEVNRAALRGATVVWLRARPDTLVARVGGGAGRPLLQGADVADRVRALYEERHRLYEQAADVVVDTDELTAVEIAEVVVERLADLAASRPSERSPAGEET